MITAGKELEQHFRKQLNLPPMEEQEAAATEEAMQEAEAEDIPTIDESELDSLDQELADLGDEFSEEDLYEVIDNVGQVFHEYILTSSFSYVAQATRDKISEGLKKYRSTRKKTPEAESDAREKVRRRREQIREQINNVKDRMDRTVDEVRTSIENLRDQAAGLPRGKAGTAQREAIRKEVKTLRERIKAIKEINKRAIEKLREMDAVTAEAGKQASQLIRDAVAKERERMKAEKKKQAEIEKNLRAKRSRASNKPKRYHEHSHDEDLAFDDDYFHNVSRRVNNDFIRNLQKVDDRKAN